MYTHSGVTVAQPRTTVQVTFADNLTLEAARGTTVGAFLRAAAEARGAAYPAPIMAGVYDNRLRELSYAIVRDGTLAPILLTHSDGDRIYRRSLVMLLATAIGELFDGQRVAVSYSVPEGGYYCTLPGRASFSAEALARLDAHMRAIVAADDSIHKSSVTLDEAIALFERRNEQDKLRLLERRTRPRLTLYTLRGRADYFYGYMLPSTGYLQTFRLVLLDEGFIVQFPQRDTPGVLMPIRAVSKIGKVFREADELLFKLGIEDIGQLNRRTRGTGAQEVILVAEALHEQRIAAIAQAIATRQRTRIVLISGPTSAGKTTFSKRLAIQLLAFGLRPFTMEMDNYFVDRELTPRDESGAYDFESLEAVNLPLFNQQLEQLVNGETVRLPRFDFVAGKSSEGREVALMSNQIVVIEGIHGLNPALLPNISRDAVYRIYVSALTPLNIDLHNRVPTTDTRLLRRIVRDAATRGTNATETLVRWASVRRGEKRHIFPYQDNADVIFNSALVYELAALRPVAEPLLLQVEPGTAAHIEANRLIGFLRWVEPFTAVQQALIPDTSLLREFIGGSILHDYHPGDLNTEVTQATLR